MKAIVWTRYGSPDGLQLREVAKPAPKDDEVLIQIHAATTSQADTEFRKLSLSPLFAIFLRLYIGIIRPTRVTIPGTEFAGEVATVGKAVTRFRPGDQVYGYTSLRMGTYAEYLCLPEAGTGMGGVMAEMPANLTYAEAAAVPFGGLEALHTLRKANLQAGQKVLIVGAGGSIGTYAVQLAKHWGAEVTGVDKAGKLDMLRALGADHVIDYAREDFTRSGQTYDVILDTISKSPFWGSLRALKENGIYLNANPSLLDRVRWAAMNSGKQVSAWSAGYSVQNLLELKALVEAGTLRPIIDRRYPLAQIAEAHRYVDSGEKKGNVVIEMEHAP